MPKKHEAVFEEIGVSIAYSETCGHVNKQFYNTEGKLQDLVCELPKGHAPVLLRVDKRKKENGETEDVPVYGVVHSAEYEYMKTDIIPSLKQRVEGRPITYVKTKTRGDWLDGAGVPAPQQEPEG